MALPQKPIGPHSAYFYYAEEERPLFKLQFPNNDALVGQSLQAGWNEVKMYDPVRLAQFEQMAEADKFRYDTEMIQYAGDMAAYHAAQQNNG